jgi:hypothetical protein
LIARAITWLLGAAIGIGAGASCRVPNPDHCENQDVPGDRFCREAYPTARYCSPCTRDLQGCVQFPPYACAGYEPDDDPSTETSDLDTTSGSTTAEGSSGDP